VFKNVQARNEKALIAYVMAGDPTLERTVEIVLELEKAGADLIELGVPFSDPVADGPTIQKAAARALEAGATLKKILELVATLRLRTKIPLILMSYCNPIYAIGLKEFFKEARRVGVDGLIVPDLPVEEGTEFASLAKRHRIDLVFLVAPTTPPDRTQKILSLSEGFIYYVSLTGITGAALTDRSSVQKPIQQIKSMTATPVAVGFGISTPEEAKEIAQAADGIIVGSALVKIIETAPRDPAYLSRLSELVSSLKQAIRF
jgi:tryptophan synthase alpha chain